MTVSVAKRSILFVFVFFAGERPALFAICAAECSRALLLAQAGSLLSFSPFTSCSSGLPLRCDAASAAASSTRTKELIDLVAALQGLDTALGVNGSLHSLAVPIAYGSLFELDAVDQLISISSVVKQAT